MGKDIAATEVALVEPTGRGLTGELELTGAGEDGNAEGAELVGADSGTELARRGQRGMVSAEWAVGIVAAISIAGVLLAVITNGSVKQALLKFVLWVIETFVSVVS